LETSLKVCRAIGLFFFTLRQGYVGPISKTKNCKGRKSNKDPTNTADRKFLGELEKEDLQQQI
jgi:hypothetical protein